MTSVLHLLSGSTIDGAAYTLDNAGNRTAKTDERAGVTSNYSFDAIYELTQVTQGTNTTESYTFDAVGNRLSSLGVSPYSYNSSNELTSTPSATYTFDNNGNTLTKVVGSNTTSYTWDFENRLSSVTLPGSAGTISFAYDPFGRRIKKVTPTATSIFAYDGDNLVEETNSSGTAVARYSDGLNIDEPLAMLRSSTTSYYNADGLGTVTSLANTAGALAQTYTFDSFGNTTASSGSLTNPFQYTARESDPETGLYYYRARYYDQNIGRFLSQDPIGFYAGSNFYAYADNSSISLLDPRGLCPCQSTNDHPNNDHPFFPIRTGGLVVGASGEAGLGSIGGSAVTGNFGFGESSSHMAGVASGAVATSAGNYASGFPHQDPKTTGVYGAYVGAGVSLFASNGQPCDLQGPFKTLNFNLGIGFFSWSGSLALGENGVYQISISPVGFGLGASVSAFTTNTAVTPCCN